MKKGRNEERTVFSVKRGDLFKVFVYDDSGRRKGTFRGKDCKGIMSVYVYALRSLKEQGKKASFFPRMQIFNLTQGLSTTYEIKEYSSGSLVFKRGSLEGKNVSKI